MAFRIKKEIDIEEKIYDLISKFTNKKFNGVTILKVKRQYDVGENRRADIAILKDDGKPLVLIETKKKSEKSGGLRSERRFLVTSKEVVGQALSYAAILKRKGIYVPFVATANDIRIAAFFVPRNIDEIVEWRAIWDRDYSKVLKSDFTYMKIRDNYLIKYDKIRFTEAFFSEFLDLLTGLFAKRYKLEEKRQELHQTIIEEFRGFVDTLTPYVLDAISQRGKYIDRLAKIIEGYAKRKGYSPPPKQLAREMAYVLLNKIVFYKVLERYYNLVELRPLYEGGQADTINKYLKRLNEFFEEALVVTRDFEPVFRTGIYDKIEIVESEEVLALFDFLVKLVKGYTIEKLGDLLGYVYEDLIPAEERHQLGQFYTPKPIAELIVKWAVRDPDDRILDPGCGSGTFLIEAYKRLFELKMRRPYGRAVEVPEDVHRQILKQLYGIDINEFPVHLTTVNLAMRNPRSPSRITQMVVDDFFNIRPGQERLTQFTVKTPEGEKPLKIVFGDFDAVVGNPPYTRWTEIPSPTQDSILRLYGDILRQYGLTPQVARGVEPGIFTYWIIHSTRFLRDGGRLGMIISDSWLQTEYGVNFGKFLLDNYRVVALIDIAARVFPVPLVGACIVLLEKEPDKEKRMKNKTVFMLLKPEKSIEVNHILNLIEDYSKKDEGSYEVSDEVVIRVVQQEKIYEGNSKWINYLFDIEEILNTIAKSPLVKKLSDWFEVSYGNILYLYLTSTGKIRGVRNVGGNQFFYLSEDRAKELGIPDDYLYPLLPSPRYATFFTFSNKDWETLKERGKECLLFLCHKPRNELPKSVKKYIQLGEGSKAIIRLRSRAGKSEGKPVNESQAAQVRDRHKELFYSWYDLGGVKSVKIFASRYTQYWHRFIYAKDINLALDDDLMAFIPKEKMILNEIEYKALLAYLNSSTVKFYLETQGRTTGGGALALEANLLSNTPILNVKALKKSILRKLAQLFDKLEARSRKLGGAEAAENVFGSELADELTGKKVKSNVEGLFNTVIKEIDYEVGKILGLGDLEIKIIRDAVIDLTKRRLSRVAKSKSKAKGREPGMAKKETAVTLDYFS